MVFIELDALGDELLFDEEPSYLKDDTSLINEMPNISYMPKPKPNLPVSYASSTSMNKSFFIFRALYRKRN